MDIPTRQEIEQFCALVGARLGYRVDDHNVGQADEILRRRLGPAGCGSVASYLERFKDPRFFGEEIRQLAAEFSVAETYFYRHPEQFRAMTEVAIPERVKARSHNRQLRVLSAACASGEEAYSLAAAIRAALAGYDGWDIWIRGIDANPRLLEKAAEARYGPWSLRGMTDEEQRRHFCRKGREFVLNADTRSLVAFEERNLLDDDPSFWQPERFDIIFCRNVMIYLTSEATKQVVRRLTHSLAAGGFLFLGPSETLRGITQEFHLRHTHGAFYYQRKHPGETAERIIEFRGGVELPRGPAAVASTSEVSKASEVRDCRDTSWTTAISRAAGRIAALAEQSQQQSCSAGVSPARENAGETPAPQPVGAGTGPEHPLEPVRDFLKRERFEDALRALPSDSESDPDVLLLRAALLLNKGEVAQAAEICQRLLAVDDLNAGAHYLTAVCREHSGDSLGAAEHDQQAIYLDADFAMPRMHLGLLAKRLGDLSTARRELAEALERLDREHSSRILLFGGGFSRETLVQYCRSQLRHCGGTP